MSDHTHVSIAVADAPRAPFRWPPLLFVTPWPSIDASRLVAIAVRAAEALPPGVFGVQLRAKGASPEARAELAHALGPPLRAAGARLVLNGDVALADAVRADALHFGGELSSAESSAPNARLSPDSRPFSRAAHADADVRAACALGATAVLVSPIFETPGKGPARGVEALRAARTCDQPAARDGSAPRRPFLYALGGVDASRVAACIAAGADGVAVIRAIAEASDPAAAARALHAALSRAEAVLPVLAPSLADGLVSSR